MVYSQHNFKSMPEICILKCCQFLITIRAPSINQFHYKNNTFLLIYKNMQESQHHLSISYFTILHSDFFNDILTYIYSSCF